MDFDWDDMGPQFVWAAIGFVGVLFMAALAGCAFLVKVLVA